MNFKSVLEICAAILASLGGAGAILLKFSEVLGKFWVDRAIEKERHQYTEMLQEAKSKLDMALNRYQVELDTLKLTHQLRTTEEFSHLGQLWKRMAKLGTSLQSAANVGLRFVPSDPDEEKKYWERLRASFFQSLTEAQDFYWQEKLFIPSEIAEQSQSMIRIAIEEANLYQAFAEHPEPSMRRPYMEGVTGRIRDYFAALDKLEAQMRAYIGPKSELME